MAYSEILPDETRRSCPGVFLNTLRIFEARGVKVQRLMTDYGTRVRSHCYAEAMRRLGIKHIRTKPRRQTPMAKRSAPPTCRSGSIAAIGISRVTA